MKRRSHRAGILTSISSMAIMVAALSSCDVLRTDPDLKKTPVLVTGNEVYALSKGSTLIDLSSRIQTTQAVTLTITKLHHSR